MQWVRRVRLTIETRTVSVFQTSTQNRLKIRKDLIAIIHSHYLRIALPRPVSKSFYFYILHSHIVNNLFFKWCWKMTSASCVYKRSHNLYPPKVYDGNFNFLNVSIWLVRNRGVNYRLSETWFVDKFVDIHRKKCCTDKITLGH